MSLKRRRCDRELINGPKAFTLAAIAGFILDT